MLFDLKGKRRRAVQGTYLALALLMGAGLVLFGIGGNQSGSPLDAINGNGGNTAEEQAQKEIKKAEKALAKDPKDTAALAKLVRNHYALAGQNVSTKTQLPTSKGRAEYQKATDAWARYVAAEPEKPDTGLASVAIQAYQVLAQTAPKDDQGKAEDPAAEKKLWQGAAGAAELIAESKENPQNYVVLVQLATLAGQDRKAELAGKKAVELASPKQKKKVQMAVDEAKSQGQGQGGASAPSTPALPGQ